MTDKEREFHARRFFWEMMDKWDQIVSVKEAQRQIAKLAECLPPFTKLHDEYSERVGARNG